MIFSLCPAFSAQAAGDVWDGSVDISWYDPGETRYTLSTPAQLAGLAALVNGMTDPRCPGVTGDASLLKSIRIDGQMLVGAGGGNVSDTVYTSSVDFAGKTVYLAADLDMGGVYNSSTGTWTGPNWTPIGGKFPMKPEEAKGDCLTLDTRFNGVLDGQGHSIKNLYCDRYAQKGFPYSMAIGVVGFLGGTPDADTGVSTDFSGGWQPAVKNLVLLSGSILGRRMVGGIVGRVGETSNGVIVENCANFASVKSTDAKGVGGVVGSGWGKGVIRNCYNSGYVSTTYSSPAGGIVGTNGGMDVYNCYNVGKIDTNGQSRGRGIGSHDTGSYTVSNCYYLEGCGDDAESPGYYVGLSKKVNVSVSSLSSAALKSEETLAKLNASGGVFVADRSGINGGFPILWFQAGASGGECSISVKQAPGGKISADLATASFGQTVSLSCVPDAGYMLEYYTLNGKPLAADFFTATEDSSLSAVFTKLSAVKISIPEDRDYYAAVAREGWKQSPNGLEWTDRELLRSGDTLMQGNKLTVMVYGYEDASPADMDMEYIDSFVTAMTGAEKNADGSYTVTGDENVTLSVSRREQPKSWLRFADTDWYLSGGRREEYVITTPEELAGLAWLVNRGGYDFSGVTIRLGNDISLENTDGTVGLRLWTPIGQNVGKAFKGVFDGDGHSVYNMTVRAEGSYAALFGCCVGAEIRGLSVYGEASGSASASYAAGIAAYLSGGTITECRNYASVTASGTHAGGIAAMLRDGARVEACENYGAVSAVSGLGGIAGISDSGEDVISSCANFAAVSSTGDNSYGCGGIVGRLAGKAEMCVNYGNISGSDRYTGGVAGYTPSKNTSVLALCANRAEVSSASTTRTAALGGIVGYARYLHLSSCENSGAVKPGSGFPAANLGDIVGKSGELTEYKAEGSVPDFTARGAKSFASSEKSACTVSFVAGGKIVASVPYTAGDASVAEPAVPAREGYIGYWDNYSLGAKDIRVNAVYRQKLVRDGDTVTENGSYHITWFSSGEIKIADGVSAVLCGENGGDSGFDALRISVGKGAALTLENTVLNGDMTLMSFAGSNTLNLSGSNELLSRAEAAENAAPAMLVSGDLTIIGNGSLYVSGGLKNSAIYLDRAGSTLELKGGELSVYKAELLGFEGGAFHAPGSKLVISGGCFKGHTVSDNVAVIYAASTELSGGRLLVQAERCPAAIMGAFSSTGGEIAAYGHDGNSAATSYSYSGKAAIPGLSGSANFVSLLPFTDVFVTDPYYEAVESCCRAGYFSGVSETRFAPDDAMTRAMFVTVLYRLAGSPAASSRPPFTDLRQDWYKSAVSWAVSKGITNGASETEFLPDAPVTREQAAVFLYRFAQLSGDKLPRRHSSVSHGEVSSWAEAEVLWALSRGLFDGVRAPMASPQDFAPRSLLASAIAAYAGSR
jgi:hypothetical protein